MIWLLIPIALASGVLGRMGGAGKSGSWYDRILDTKWRDVGCSLLVILAIGVLWGWQASFWWVYVLIFGLHWAAFSTYLDKVFGYDNFLASGGMVGLALAPICIIDYGLWWVVTIRVIGLAVIWWALNKYLPQRVFIWGRDVAEEFSRYFVSL